MNILEHLTMPNPQRIVLDTNCLLASLSRHGEYYSVWDSFRAGKYTLCVSTSILEEYEEIIGQKTSPVVAKNVIALLLKSKNVELIHPYFNFYLVEADHDDDKFVDCAFSANAAYIVSEDKHFSILQKVTFPKIFVLKLREFMEILEKV